MNPQWLAREEPFILLTPIGHDKVPMFFWGPFPGPGAEKKKEGLLRFELFKGSPLRNPDKFNYSLDPDGCLLADQSFEKPGAAN